MKSNGWILVGLVVVTAVGTVGARLGHADDADAFFDDSFVHEVYITFTDADWYDTLYASHANDPDDPYFAAAVEIDGEVFDPVGVRFKGNSSFNIPGVKKSFKIDFNEYDDETTFVGLKKLNLDNGYKDPTLLRAKLFLDFAGAWVPTIRAVHTRVYVNGTYWGLYTAIEQVDKTFAESRFGDDEDGNLFKGAASDDASGPSSDFGSDLTWLGSDPESYHDNYQLKTNETADDYSQLIEFIDILNNQSPADFPTLLEPVFDVQNALAGLALNSLFVNLDAYNGSAHNYYVYDRDDSGRITHIHWDTNETFGRFLMSVSGSQDPLELDPFWLPGSIMGQQQERPLMENLWANDQYSGDYLCYLQNMLDEGFDESTMASRIDRLADLIRSDVYADDNKMYSNNEFEQNLYSDIIDGRDRVYGLLNFVEQRAEYLDGELDDFGLDCPEKTDALVGILFINEVMAENDTTIQDPDGTGYPDWFEIYNASSSTVDLGGLYLSDDLDDPTMWQVPLGVSIEAFGHLLFWADNDEPQGDTHTNFKLSASGEEIGLFDSDGLSVIDSVVFGGQTADVSYGRSPDGEDDWGFMATATPGSANGSVNAPPGISGTAHSPAWPTDGDVVWVTATVNDDNGVAGATLIYDAGGSAVVLSMFDDGAHGDGGAGDGLYGAQIPAHATGTVVGYYVSAADSLGAGATDPAAAPAVTYSFKVGYTQPVLFINEFMADNDATLEDPDDPGAYDDWFEIYNAGSTTADLGGMYLTDDAGDPTQWKIPAGVSIGPGDYLLFWADNDEEQGDTHTNFKLGADGEFIGLYESDDNGNLAIDSVTFGAQATDVSFGRCPDGGSSWQVRAQATPGASNNCGASVYSCVPSETAICLGAGDRFQIELEWTDFQEQTASAWARKDTQDSGFFHYGNADNLEFLVKVVDGQVLNGHYWFFAGAATNVGFSLRVTDTQTQAVRVYENPLGNFASFGDTEAFSDASPAATIIKPMDTSIPPDQGTQTTATGACEPSDTTMCLGADDRFRVELGWTDFQGQTAAAFAREDTRDSGFFHYGNPENLEFLVKVIDGEAVNNNFWVFSGGATNVGYVLTVTDTISGTIRTYENPLRNFASFGDTEAFPSP